MKKNVKRVGKSIPPKILKNEYGLTQQEETFCQLFSNDPTHYGSGIMSYCTANGIKHKYIEHLRMTDRKGYNVIKSAASSWLTRTDLCNRIAMLLELNGWNNDNVDKQLLSVINQHEDRTSKIQAIKEYNILMKRIETKVENNIYNLSQEELMKVAGVKPIDNDIQPTNAKKGS